MEDIIVGGIYESNYCGTFMVIEKVSHPKGTRYLCRFDSINGIAYQKIAQKKDVLNGTIRNPYFPVKLGIASVGNVNSKNFPKEFNKWRAMIERCYDTNNSHFPHYGGKGIVVCERWLCFEFFLEDLTHLNGYDKELMQLGVLHLDKDIIGDGTTYSPEHCILTTASENVKEMNKRVKQHSFKATRIEDGQVFICDNQTEFAKMVGFNQANLSRCLHGKQKTFGGFKLEFI